ncbi:MAG: carboxylating nicotinate-nucleotide diphosphorylase, partial [Cyclobacteriaceae bacterium]
MIPEFLSTDQLRAFISSALAEDIGSGDHSTMSTIPADQTGTAKLLVKSEGILAGVELAGIIFSQFDTRLQHKTFLKDGDRIKKGDIAFEVSGPVRSILTTERLVLNSMQRMSGIATRTSRFVELLHGTKTLLLDTRKTTPNFRAFEKWAVVIGGGMNHRFSLGDLIMLKDNHIDACGGILPAISAARNYCSAHGLLLQIEVETRNLNEVQEAIAGQPDIIMLDNMSVSDMKVAVQMIAGRCQTEA